MEQLSNISPVDEKTRSIVGHSHRRASLPTTSITKPSPTPVSKAQTLASKSVKRTSSLSEDGENKENVHNSNSTPAVPPSNLTIPSKVKYEVNVSPVVEQTLHQQQLLIQQQQEFIQIQKEIYVSFFNVHQTLFLLIS